MRAYATQLLAALARPVPAAVLYAAVAAAAAAAPPPPELAALLAAVSAGGDGRVAHCRALLDGLRRLTPTAAEAWQAALHAALVDLRRSALTLKSDAVRLGVEGGVGALWQRRYGALTSVGVGRLRALHEVCPSPPCHLRFRTSSGLPTLRYVMLWRRRSGALTGVGVGRLRSLHEVRPLSLGSYNEGISSASRNSRNSSHSSV